MHGLARAGQNDRLPIIHLPVLKDENSVRGTKCPGYCGDSGYSSCIADGGAREHYEM
jgi:hypothetical protein